MISSRILLDSISPAGHRLTTFELVYPRSIHAQVLTHRVFSRNAQSARAERVEVVRNRVISDPVRPLEWRYAQKGMQSGALMSRKHREACRVLWDRAMWSALETTKDLLLFDAAKEHVNRLLHPFDTITVLLSGTEFDNFFELRTKSDAQPEIRTLAFSMKEQYGQSSPNMVGYGDYHMPLGDGLPDDLDDDIRRKVSVARCARVSYGTHSDDSRSLEKEVELYDRLLSSRHMSPFEHVARPYNPQRPQLIPPWDKASCIKNLVGWVTHRTEIENDTK